MKNTWRRIPVVEKERAEFGGKADAMLGFLKRTKKHGKIERSHFVEKDIKMMMMILTLQHIHHIQYS